MKDSHQIETLRLLRTVTPPALAHLSPAELAPFRVAAEDDCKTGRSRAAIRMVKGLPTRCHLTPEGALFTLIFHVNAIHTPRSPGPETREAAHIAKRATAKSTMPTR